MIQLLRKCLYIFQLKVIPQSVKNLVLCGYWNHITAPPETLPAPQRKKLILRKPKRKTPQVVQEDEDEDDEATEDDLVTKRKRVAPSSPPALPTPTPPFPPAPTPPSPQPQPRWSKQHLWQSRFLRLKATSPTSWRTLLVPPRRSYLLERVLLRPPQLLKPHQVGMKVLTTHRYS